MCPLPLIDLTSLKRDRSLWTEEPRRLDNTLSATPVSARDTRSPTMTYPLQSENLQHAEGGNQRHMPVNHSNDAFLYARALFPDA